jgi:acyl-coenzyme A thioesterase PaaI-like protein
MFRETEEGSVGTFVPSEHHEGWPGVVHGGILAALLDEAMAYAVWFAKTRAVTARLETRFRTTVAAGDSLVITGRVTGRRRNLLDAEGAIVRSDGTPVAEATARFVPADVSY